MEDFSQIPYKYAKARMNMRARPGHTLHTFYLTINIKGVILIIEKRKELEFMITIVTICPICRKETEITVRFEDFLAWQEDTHAEDAFPYLSANEREMLISGVCPSCWDSMWDDEEEEEEEA